MNAASDPVSKPRPASRSGRYRRLLFEPASLAPFATRLAALFADLDAARSAGALSDPESVALALTALLALRGPRAFEKQARPAGHPLPFAPAMTPPLSPRPSTTLCTTPFTLRDFWRLVQRHDLPLAVYARRLDRAITVTEFINETRWRGIPQSAGSALSAWMQGLYPLRLHDDMPSTAEVFALQKQGRRCITLFRRPDEIAALHHGRDVLSFCIHDLIHAHEFYADPLRMRQQIGFYHWLDGLLGHPLCAARLGRQPDFAAACDYLIADMNSYCGHLLKTLRAAFAQAGAPDNEWQALVAATPLTPVERETFARVNAPGWSDADFKTVESCFERFVPEP